MAGDDFQLLNGLAQHGGSAGGDIAVEVPWKPGGGPVLLIELIGQGVI